jgi:hypothetical protein
MRRADHLSKDVLWRVVCLSVIEESQRGGLGPLELSIYEKIGMLHCKNYTENLCGQCVIL